MTTTPEQVPPKGFPDLSNYGSNADVKTKPGGKSKNGRPLPPIKYIPWATIASILRKHAPGWDFNLRAHPETKSHVWRAPDGTGYIVGYFEGRFDTTADFPYAITNFYNQPIQYDQISAADLCTAHRRGMCACAAYSFGLYYALWSGLEIKENDSQSAEGGSEREGLEVSQGDVPVQPEGPKLEADALTSEEKDELLCAFGALNAKQKTKAKKELLAAFPEIPKDTKSVFSFVQERKHWTWAQSFLSSCEVA